VTTASLAAIDRAALVAMGEWMAAGFYEGIALPWPRAHGLAYRRLYEHMPLAVPEGHWLLPYEPLPGAQTFTGQHAWSAKALIMDFQHSAGLILHLDIAEEKKARFPQYARVIDALIEDMLPRQGTLGGYTHSNPDIRRVMTEGFLAIEAELQAALAEDGDNPLLLALQDYAAGARALHRRLQDAVCEAAQQATGARRTMLGTMRRALDRAFLYPADSFYEGLLGVHFTWMLDGCDSIGRFDQALGPLFDRDLASGALYLAFARQLLDEVWQNFERLNGWNLQIGGYTPDGRDGANALTRECIAACARNHVRRPNVALRVTTQTPDDVLAQAIAALGKGSGRPALYNDDLYVQTLLDLDLGLTPEDAREVGFGGCTETMIAGMSNVGSLEGELNLAQALVLALHDGFNPQSGRQEGPHTGRFVDFTDFDDILDAVKRQIVYATDAFVARDRVELEKRFTQMDPKLARTLFTRDCVKMRKSFEAGGARYNWAVVSYQGIANLIDGLAAIRQCVFTERSMDAAMLLAALAADFQGYEDVQARLRAAPKFGNDDPAVDDLGAAIVGFAWDTLLAHETPRGGRYLPSCILFVTYYGAGLQVSATPDGRRAGEVLTDSVGPAQGRDTHGPTAMLNSVTRLPLHKAIGTPVLNLRFQHRVFDTPEGVTGVAALVRAFFANGGLQAQISVLSSEELRAAQAHPEQYRDLIVRIGGYSEYFTNLPKPLQDSVIARAEYDV
jgi:formate C-acetyltransferase